MRFLHARFVFPGTVFLRGEGSVFERRRQLEAMQWWPLEKLTRAQDERLVELVRHASERVPFYRSRLSALEPFDVTTVRERLPLVPLVSKTDLQQRQHAMVAQPLRYRVTRKTTGGSTGQAVTLLKNRAAIAAELAGSLLGYGWMGIRVGDRAARFWGSPTTWKRRLRSAAADLAMHRIRFSAFAFDDNDLERYWHRCLAFRPDWFYGYVSMLEAFAQFVRRRGYDGAALRLRAIVTTAEVLAPGQRALLAETFNTRVQNEYGCGEVGPIAYECERGGLHLMTGGQLVEILRPDGQPAAAGETGQIVVTDLNNYAMPLIRYALADLAVPGAPCACGRGFPVLERVWGRAYDFVEAPDGKRYHGEFFMYMFEDLRSRGLGVRQFQVVQQSRDRLEVRVVSDAAMDDALRAPILDIFRSRIPHMTVVVIAVNDIPRQRSGKQRVIVNETLAQQA